MRIPVFVILSLGLLASRASAAIVDAESHPATIPFGPGAQAAANADLPLTPQEAAASLQMALESHHAHFQIQDSAHVASHVQVAQQSTSASRLTQIIANLEARWSANPTLFDRNNPIMGALVADLVKLQSGTIPPLSSMLGAWFARRDLNPSRFDHWHPLFGPMLSIDQQLRAFLPNNPPPTTGTGGQIVLPPGGGTTDNGGNPPGTVPNAPPPTPPPPPPLGEQPSSPEPSAWLLLAMGAGLLGCRARFGRARGAA